ncbi:MAG: ABC transporter ATP-binding protein [Candidatus Korarchaeota archaeon]|nr:ABC transporter ATP-binding protein [Candidatus Korarchaeota archaeon]
MILSLRNVSYSYPDGTPALRDVNLEVRSGEIAFVMGPNGSGKTTLLLLMAGLLTPTEGGVTFYGKPLGNWFRKHCGILFQDPRDQLLAPTVWEDVALAPKQLGLDEGEVMSRVEEALRYFGIEDLASRSPLRLSRGQAAKVILAGLLAHDPEVLLLDEPWSSLDAEGTEHLLELIKLFKERNRIVVISSQNSDMAAEISDTVHILKNGELVMSGLASDLLVRVEELREIGIRPPLVPSVSRMIFPADPPVLRFEDLLDRLERTNSRSSRP